MTAPTSRAVFLSYASQDAEAARRICEALRASGVEVWFDADGGLEHGDEWDAKIRKQIKECVLFIPIISANTQVRHEGYFRIEWDLAAERARGIASGVAFILPVVIDDTREPEALVPDRFKAVQWTRLPGGVVTPEVKARYVKLWSQRLGAAPAAGSATLNASDTFSGAPSGVPPSRQRPSGMFAAVCILILVAAGATIWRPWKDSPKSDATASSPAVADLVSRAWKLVDNPGRGRVELEAADELCKRAAALEPTNASVLAVWAQIDSWMILLKVDDSPARREAGRTRAKRALQLAPELFEARLALPCFEVREHGRPAPENAPEIEATLRGLLRERPGEPHALIALGMLQRFAGKPADARKTFEELTRNPEFAAVGWCEMAFMHFNAREYAEAEQTVEASIARHPFFWNLALKTWLASYWRGDLELAVATLARLPPGTLREDEGFDTAFAVHAMRRDGAALLRLLENTPREWISGPSAGPKAGYMALAYTFLGREQAAAVERTAALRIVERRLIDAPSSVDLLGWKCWLLAQQGDAVEAARAAELLRQIRTSRDRLGEAMDHVFLQQFDAAVDVLEQLEKNPPDALFTAAFVRHMWVFDPLRNQPRFQALQARLDADPRFSPAAKPVTLNSVAAPDAKSVAVLPFANLSGDPTQDYFSDGLTVEIHTALSNERDLRVPGSTSTFAFKGRALPVPEIARALHVAQVVEGTVRKSGDQVKITVSLTRASDGFSEPLGAFTEKFGDVFALQEKVARVVVEKLTKRTTTASRASESTKNSAAYDTFLRARAAQIKGGNYPETIALFEECVRLDPTFALAWARYAEVLIRTRRAGFDRSEQIAAKAREAAATALRLNRNLPEAHLAMAALQIVVEYNLDAAERELDEAQRLRPNDPEVPAARVILESARGHWDDSLVALIRQAVALDPQNTGNHLTMARYLNNMGRFAEAQRLWVFSWEISQESHMPVRGQALTHLAWTGDIAGALGVLATLPPTLRDHPLSLFERASMLALQGNFAAAIEVYEKVRANNPGTASGPRSLQIDAGIRAGRLEARRGASARAAELYTQASAMLAQFEKDFPEDLSGALSRARLAAFRGEKPGALAAADEAVHRATRMHDANEVVNARRRKAEVLAIFGDARGAVAELAAVHDMGFAFGYRLRQELELEPLRGDPKFQALMKEAETRADAQPRTAKP